MVLTEIIGFGGAIIIGLTLGLIGGGGSILTVPILVYLLGVEPVLATAYSLFVVGATSILGVVQKFRLREIDVHTAVLFMLPSLLSIYFARRYVVPIIPDPFMSVPKATAIMVFFGMIMIVAGLAMLREKSEQEQRHRGGYGFIILEGLSVGLLTGVVGAGGGFLIVPALVLLGGLPMKLAVGSSLFIISFKAAVGFVGDLNAGREIQWEFLLIFTALSGLGIVFGTYLSKFVDGNKLKKAFGIFVIAMAMTIWIRELFL
ncbi:MAG: sulfite exporter TauE/SafE family protein [Cyclobacteriaceae bacterium]|nr:sulfite exporter TauE/SafE family protein [Cyclobacteriaceae bacterium HetDA_MAG_MS6]